MILLASLLGVGILLSGLLPFSGWMALLLYVSVFLPLGVAGIVHFAGCQTLLRRRIFSLSGMAFVLILGVLIGYVQRSRETVQWPESPRIYSALILSQPKLNERSVSFQARVSRGPVVQLWLPRSPEADSLQAGQGMDFAATISAPHNFGDVDSLKFDYAAYLRHQGVSGIAYVRYWRLSRRVAEMALWTDRVQLSAIRLSNRADTFIRGMGLETEFSTLLSAMLLGRKSGLSAETRSLYQQVGASHILALSGLHLSILMGLLLYLLVHMLSKPVWRVCVGAIGLLLIWSYVVLTGFSPSLVRASVMMSMFVLSLMLGRGREMWHTLGLAALVMLFISPRTIYDVGFQLSFAAMVGLLGIEPLLSRLWRPGNLLVAGVWTLIRIAISAQTATLPLTIFYFHQFPLYGILFGVLFAFLATWIVWLTLSALFLHVIGVDWLIPWLQQALTLQRMLMKWLSHVPGNMIYGLYFSIFQIIMVYLAIASLVLMGYRPRTLSARAPYLLTASLAIFLFAICCRFQVTV